MEFGSGYGYESVKVNGTLYSLKDFKLICRKKTDDPFVQQWEKDIYTFYLSWFDDASYIIQQTSGSTGEPKKIRISKEAMVISARMTLGFFDLKSDDVTLLCLPVKYIAGKMMIIRALEGGLDLHWQLPTGIPILHHDYNFAAMVPMQVYGLINNKVGLSKIKNLIIGGAEIPTILESKLKSLPNTIYATYGMTETMSHVALRKVNEPDNDEYFKALPGISFNQNESGCLNIYASKLLKAPVFTHDLVELKNEREFKWLGRIDNVINSGGIKLIPEQIENEISNIINRDCVLVSIADQKLGNKPILVIEGNKDKEDKSLIKAELNNIFEKYKLPKEFLFLRRVPKNENFKTDRKRVLLELDLH